MASDRNGLTGPTEPERHGEEPRSHGAGRGSSNDPSGTLTGTPASAGGFFCVRFGLRALRWAPFGAPSLSRMRAPQTAVVAALFAHNILWKPANVNVKIGTRPSPTQTPKGGEKGGRNATALQELVVRHHALPLRTGREKLPSVPTKRLAKLALKVAPEKPSRLPPRRP